MFMLKVLSRSGLVVLCSLTVLVLGAVGAASASAQNPFASPAVKVCKKVPAGFLGLFSESHCLTNVSTGTYAWATPSHGGELTWYCLLGGNQYKESLCQTESSKGPFLPLGFEERFPRLLGSGGLSVLKGEVVGIKTTIDCKENTFKGQPETGSAIGEGKITYTGCTVIAPASCEVRSKGLTGLGTIETGEVRGLLLTDRLVDFHPSTGTVFVELEYIGGSCFATAANPAKIEGQQMCTFEAAILTPKELHELFCNAGESGVKFAGAKVTYEGNGSVHFEGKPLWKIQ
jgi:hypothetical protein